MKIRRAAAIAAAAAAVAMIPAAASASNNATTYTKSYSGYYAAGNIGSDWTYTVYLPRLSTLAKITNGVTSEARLASNYGTFTFQLGANPQTQSAWTIKLESTNSYPSGCFEQTGGTVPPSFPGGDTVNVSLFINDSNDSSVIDAYYSDAAGTSYWCEINPGGNPNGGIWPTYTKISFVNAFNPKSLRAPASPVLLGSFSGISNPGNSTGPGFTQYPYGRYVATSTGTATGIVRAKPSALDSTGGGFTVSIP
jgi:hypothetical protein